MRMLSVLVLLCFFEPSVNLSEAAVNYNGTISQGIVANSTYGLDKSYENKLQTMYKANKQLTMYEDKKLQTMYEAKKQQPNSNGNNKINSEYQTKYKLEKQAF